MARRRLLLALGAGIAAAVLLPLLLLVRLARADVAVGATAAPAGAFQVLVARGERAGELTLHVGPYPAVADARYAVRVAVGGNRAGARLALELRDKEGRPLGRCNFAPGEYTVERYRQSVLLTCPLEHPTALRRVLVSARADQSPVVLHARRRADGRLEGGRLLTGQEKGARSALARLTPGRPRAFRAATLLGALGLSVAALGAAGALWWGGPRRRH